MRHEWEAKSNKVSLAFSFAEAFHGNQRYGKQPYVVHLIAVCDCLQRFGVNPANDEDLCVAAVLHDVLEDTTARYDTLVEKFGKTVAEIVYAVTDELGRNRAERKAKTYPKIAASLPAVVVKLADRIANTEACFNQAELEPENMTSRILLETYRQEYPEFKRVLGFPVFLNDLQRKVIQPMWERLDYLSHEDTLCL